MTRVEADITPVIDVYRPSASFEMLSEAKRRFGPFTRQEEPRLHYTLGEHLRIWRREPYTGDRRMVVVEATSDEGEAFLREWAPRLDD